MVKAYYFLPKDDKYTSRGYNQMYIYLIDELRMYLSLSNIRHILIGLLGMMFLSLAFLYSDFTKVGFSDFTFLSGTNETNSLSIEITWGDTRTFSVIIYNKEDTDMTYRLWFVDAGITNDLAANKACLSPNETGNFWTYISGDTSLFTLSAQSSGTKALSVKFPESYSWLYHGCVMFFPSTTGWSADVNTIPRRGGFIDALVHSNAVTINVKAFPSNRVYQATNNANTWILKIYSMSKTLIATSPLFTLNNNGTGEVLINVPAGTYYVVFKGQSHLASYLSGVSISGLGGDFFDFTTGNNLYGSQNLDTQTNNGNQYQTAWDMKNGAGVYDGNINGSDITMIINGTFPQQWADVLEPRNLNGDTAINASDISVIWANCDKQDAFATAGGIFIW